QNLFGLLTIHVVPSSRGRQKRACTLRSAGVGRSRGTSAILRFPGGPPGFRLSLCKNDPRGKRAREAPDRTRPRGRAPARPSTSPTDSPFPVKYSAIHHRFHLARNGGTGFADVAFPEIRDAKS